MGPTFPVVGIGASAGGVEAVRRLLTDLPTDSGMAFVVVQHLDPEQPSMLASVLHGATQMSVVEAKSDMRVEPNRVYVMPSACDLSILGGVLTLEPLKRTGRLHLPINSFFRSLANDSGALAIGVVLSGSGSDGTDGLRATKAAGGIAIAQEPDSAQYRGMPESALAAGVVDFRGTPQEIAVELARLGKHPHVAFPAAFAAGAAKSQAEKTLAAIFALLRQHTGADFSGYKRTTVLRRIEKRIALRHVNDLEEYAAILREDVSEVRLLARDMLIHVTSFFRNGDAFTQLEQQILPEIAQCKAEDDCIRIWVPGCSTGEEAYAITICLLEALDGLGKRLSIKVFGTDLSEDAVTIARLGVYAESALVGVSPERLARFFERFDEGYRIARRVRDLCVFVKHDLTRDPPFAKLDLISCRNVLIYFDAELQRRVIPLLHYCLNPQGYLFLGQSESITGFPDLFTSVDKEHRVFQKTGDGPRVIFPAPAGHDAELKLAEGLPAERRQPAREAQRQADHLLLTRYAPPGVLINDRLEIIQFRGHTGAFLEPPPGQPQANVLRMAREGLAPHLHDAIERAKSQALTVRKQAVRVQAGSETRVVDLEVVPLAQVPGVNERYFLVLFDEGEARAQRAHGIVHPEGPPEDTTADAGRLQAELAATKDYVQSLIAEHQTTADDLASTNEEAVAANEELQSTNEELQSAKEELQSTNEELSTLNDQLQSRNQELDQVANDLVNVLSSVDIPVIIVDLDLRVRRFTPTVKEIASFIPEDVGRSIDDFQLKIQVDDMSAKLKEVIDGLSPKEWEVRRHDGRWLRMQIRPYRTLDNRLDGAVLAFVDVDALRRAVTDAEAARDYARSIVETVTAALIVLDSELRVLSANDAFCEMFGVSAKGAMGRSLFDLGASIWTMPDVRRPIEEASANRTHIRALEFATETPSVGRRIVSLTGRPIVWGAGAAMFLIAIDDVTELRALEAERAQLLASERSARLEAERANRAKDLFLATLSHELRTPLSTLLTSAQLLEMIPAEDPRVARAAGAIERAANTQARLIDDLLDVSRIVSGKLLLDLGPVDFAGVVNDAVDLARPSAQSKALDLTLEIDGAIGTVYGDMGRLQQLVNNLLTNAIKFTPHRGRVAVRLERVDRHAELTVADTGIGIRPEVLPLIFSRFVQADSSVTRTHGGLGLGLAIVRHLVDVHGGEVQAESPGEGKGATFRVRLPLGADATTTSAAPSTVVHRVEGVRVLLVDDDDDTREACAAMLAELGACVHAAASAAAAFSAIAEFRPQVILSDVAMPGEDGFSFIQRVRRLEPERGGQTPAAALTALASNEDRQRALQAGFQVHVAKPVESGRLAAVVSTLAGWKLAASPPSVSGAE